MTFKAIETQEELDRIIQDRLSREREKYSDYEELKKANLEYEKQIGSLQATIDDTNQKLKTYDEEVVELNAQITGYETNSLKTKIALQHGLPIDLVDRISGTDEESIKADVQKFAELIKPKQPTPPLKDTEPSIGGGENDMYKNLVKGLELEGE